MLWKKKNRVFLIFYLIWIIKQRWEWKFIHLQLLHQIFFMQTLLTC